MPERSERTRKRHYYLITFQLQESLQHQYNNVESYITTICPAVLERYVLNGCTFTALLYLLKLLLFLFLL